MVAHVGTANAVSNFADIDRSYQPFLTNCLTLELPTASLAVSNSKVENLSKQATLFCLLELPYHIISWLILVAGPRGFSSNK